MPPEEKSKLDSLTLCRNNPNAQENGSRATSFPGNSQENTPNPPKETQISPGKLSNKKNIFLLRSSRSLVYVHARARGREKERGIQRREGGEVVGG